MKKLAILAVVVLALSMYGVVCATPWTVSGYAYIYGDRPAPCVPVVLTVGSQCGILHAVTITNEFGFWEFEEIEWDTVSVSLVFNFFEWGCGHCTYDFDECDVDTLCQAALTSSSPTGNDFDLNQVDCVCN